MREYYHFYPVCPRCHEPSTLNSRLVREDDGMLRCIECDGNDNNDIIFPERVNLTDKNKFRKTIETVRSLHGRVESLENLPLVWKVDLNFIEREYIRWCLAARGRFLITWPWREVKFLPVLITEYLLNRKKDRVVVICRHGVDSDDRIVPYPAQWELFEHLIYLEGKKLLNIDEELRSEINRARHWQFYFPKVWVLKCRIRDIRRKKFHEFTCIEDYDTCKRELIRQISRNYGKDSIRKIVGIDKKTKIKNPDGYLDIVFREVEQRTCTKNPKYEWQWLWEVILNYHKFRRPSRIVRWEVIKSPEDLERDAEGYRLIFIDPHKLETAPLLRFVQDYDPDLILVEDVDVFLRDLIFRGEKSRNLADFLRESKTPAVLMFSTDRQFRFVYHKIRQGMLLKGCGIVFHTVDCAPVMEKLLPELSKREARYPGPCSSTPAELEETSLPVIEYRSIEELDEIDGLIEMLERCESAASIVRFLKELRRSPIPPVPGRGRVFSRRDMNVSFEYIKQRIRELGLNAENLEKVYSRGRNPLLSWLVNFLHKKLEDGSPVVVVVHGDDENALKKILKEEMPDCLSGGCLTITSWRRFTDPLTDETTIISFTPPSRLPEFGGKIIFAGSEQEVERLRRITEYRIYEFYTRPLYPLNKEDPAPEFLKNILNSLRLPDLESLLLDIPEITVKLPGSGGISSETGISHTSTRLKSGREAILILDEYGRGLFVPAGASLLVMDGRKLTEMPVITEDMPNPELAGKEIMIDKRGLYLDTKPVFLRYMAQYGEKIIFKSPPFRWTGFTDLYRDSIKWIEFIETALEIYRQVNSVSFREAEEKIASYLSSLGMTARDPDYIKNWWRDPVVIQTIRGNFKIYHVEHPKSPQDLEKLYKGLSQLVPGLTFDPEEPRRIYAASRRVQELRLSLLKGDMRRWPFYLSPLFQNFKKEMEVVLETSRRVKIKHARKVRVVREVDAFRFLDNYRDFLDPLSL